MIYVVGIIGIAFLVMMGAVKWLGHEVKAEKAQREAAESANVTLAADCKAKIDRANQQIADIGRRDAAAAARTKAAKKKADEEAAKNAGKVAALAAQAAGPPAPTPEAQCAAAAAVLSDVAKVRHP